MLSDRIRILLDTMNVTISDVARAGGCTPSNLNRVKNGVRTPPPSSPTIRFLTDGLMKIAAERHLAGELAGLCGASLRDSDEAIRTKLVGWMYEDESAYARSYQRHSTADHGRALPPQQPSAEFFTRLDRLMKIAGFSNRSLGKESGLDPSYISRLRRGERTPKYQSPYLLRICDVLLNRLETAGKLAELSALTALTVSELTDSDGAAGLRRWLFGYGSVTGYMAADELMGTITSLDELIRKSQVPSHQYLDIEKILKEAATSGMGIECGDEQRYVGVDGFRTAVIRFLYEMIKNNDRELWLYSDQTMDWMEGEYRDALTRLMAHLIRCDVKVRIIHTVSRSMPELISAIEWWMPLYLSGKITSYYCLSSAGRFFSHTLFIRPGAACITGTSVAGLERSAIYHYSTHDEVIGLAEEAFRLLMQDSRPLVEISESGGDAPEEGGFIKTDHVLVNADSDQVVIRRTEHPYLEFTFTHPMIVRAFGSYMDAGRHD